MGRRRNAGVEVDKENGNLLECDLVKLKGEKRSSKQKNIPEPISKKPRTQALDVKLEKNVEELEGNIVGSGRQAAQNLNFQERTLRTYSRNDRLIIKEDVQSTSELSALVDTEAGMPSIKSRRLGDFSVTDAKGHVEPIENVSFGNGELFLSGIIYPHNGAASKETGRRLEKFGPLRSYSIDVSGKTPGIMLKTDLASYVVIKPANNFKRLYQNLSGQAEILYEVCSSLSPHKGGSSNATLEEVVAHLARSKSVKGFSTPREGLLVNGKFVLSQLRILDDSSKSRTIRFSDTPFVKCLEEALESFRYVGAQALASQNKGIIIKEPVVAGDEHKQGSNQKDAQVEADEDLARQLQAKMDAEMLSRRNSSGPKNSQVYIKVSEAEIADDYPPPSPYVKEEEETDELILAEEEMMNADPEFLPRRLLTDFAIYNTDGLLATLELLPMSSGVDADIDLYASGVVVEDDGDFSGAQTLALSSVVSKESNQEENEEGGSSSAKVSKQDTKNLRSAGMRMYLSQIREWVVEFGADMIFITIRTDVAWYRLAQPSERYIPWFNTVLRCSRIAAQIMGMISEAARASRLSYNDVVKRLLNEAEDSPIFVSKRLEKVERFLAVHAQIILSCFQNHPIDSIRRSAFVTQLKERLALVRHSKLYQSVRKVGKTRTMNSNPMKDRAAGSKSKPMTATATTMVKSIWQAYFSTGSGQGNGPMDTNIPSKQSDGTFAPLAMEVEDDENEEDNEDDVSENALAGPSTRRLSTGSTKIASNVPVENAGDFGSTSDIKSVKKAAAKQAKKNMKKVSWVGSQTRSSKGKKFYSRAKVGNFEISIGSAVAVAVVPEDMAGEDNNVEGNCPLGLVQALWQDTNGEKWVQIRELVRGMDTVLGDAASTSELFLTSEFETLSVDSIQHCITAKQLKRPWDASQRIEFFKQDAELRARNECAIRDGKEVEYFWRSLYLPEKGMFCEAPTQLSLGTIIKETDVCDEATYCLSDGSGFVKEGVTYKVGDFMFVAPKVFDQMPEAVNDVKLPEYLAQSRYHKGSYEGLRAWGICRLAKVNMLTPKKGEKSASKKDLANKEIESITVLRYWRPEDISIESGYKSSSFYDVYSSNEKVKIDVKDVVRPLSVVPANGENASLSIDKFQCIGSFERKSKTFGPIPNYLVKESRLNGKTNEKSSKSRGNCKGKSDDTRVPGDDGIALASMDIFAGCGGLTEGMHQAGAAYTRWAIEYEVPAADAFKENYPYASVFCNNCNVLLHAAMTKAGLESDCLASEEAQQESRVLPLDEIKALPLPGEVEFICGGPPCQGYSGMNRFNKGNWSMVQNSMVMSFLSYADFYRPRYFLLENVRNFVSHNKSFTFRLTLRSLLDMGYQVRFGVLNAGNFGVAQSRKRTFIWAAAPGEILPDWPQLMHCFRTPQLCINLPGGVQYMAAPQTDGAPLRPVTVRDAIGDLPVIKNGDDINELSYTAPPQSAFQRAVRKDCTRLMDHISKQMNDLNLERCRCIPKNCPGADWRVLEEIVRQDPSREKFKGQPLVPWCLPNTADRHNGWRGLFGRLDWQGHFPTSTTDPQPMGKVGQVFHPEQDRIVSVRECARAQGFPDSHRFYGSVQNKHRQVGNAVPPPLAAALGRQLRAALEAKASEQAAALLQAQL